MHTHNIRFLIAAALLVTGPAALAGQVNGLTTFTAGTPAKAAEVNGNFGAVKTAVDDNATEIATLKATIATLQTKVDTQQATITDLQGDIAILKQGPRAYAVVEFQSDGAGGYNPVLMETRTKNFYAVRRSGYTPGSYCLTLSAGINIDPASTPAVVTPDWGLTLAAAGEQLFAYVDTTNRECASGEFGVVTNTATGAGRSIVAFSLVVP